MWRGPMVTQRLHEKPVSHIDYMALWPDVPDTYTGTLPTLPPRIRSLEERQELEARLDASITNMLRSGINDGALIGEPAFKAVEAMAEPQAFHGSPVQPPDLREGVLQPNPPSWRAYGHKFDDGDAAICFTPDRQLAAFFGLLGPAVLDLEGEFRAWGIAPRPYGYETARRTWTIASAEALRRSLGRQAVAYSVDLNQVPLYEFDHPKRQPEHRLHRPVPYQFATRVTTADLPKRLLVVDADYATMSAMWKLIVQQGVHPLDLEGFPEVTTLEGAWDIQDHEYYRDGDPDPTK